MNVVRNKAYHASDINRATNETLAYFNSRFQKGISLVNNQKSRQEKVRVMSRRRDSKIRNWNLGPNRDPKILGLEPRVLKWKGRLGFRRTQVFEKNNLVKLEPGTKSRSKILDLEPRVLNRNVRLGFRRTQALEKIDLVKLEPGTNLRFRILDLEPELPIRKGETKSGTVVQDSEGLRLSKRQFIKPVGN